MGQASLSRRDEVKATIGIAVFGWDNDDDNNTYTDDNDMTTNSKKHDIKLQTTYRMGENKDGVEDNDLDELFVQMQYVF